MNPMGDVPDIVHRGIIFGIILYFALFLYGGYTGDTVAMVAAYLVFGIVALGVGVVLFSAADQPFSPLGGAGICLIIGGLTQLVWVVLGDLILNTVATVAVFAGIGLYVFAVWTDS